ncbi:MAG TPA: alpha/beta hydrolase [Rectinemataceae bacterium]
MMSGSFIMAGGLNLYYAQAGSGPAVVYIHGNTGSSLWYSKAMDLPGRTCYALDLPNFGRSDPMPGDVDLFRYAESVSAFIEALGLEKPLVVGHSLGGAVAQALAVSSPGIANGLVLVDSAAPSGLKTPRDRYPLIEMMRTDRAFLSKALAATVPTLKDPSLFEALVDDALRMAEKAWIGNAEALSAFDISGKTQDLDLPVCVIWGKLDYIVTEAMARETAQAYAGARLEILDGVGHSVLVEDPGRFLAILGDFASKIGQ